MRLFRRHPDPTLLDYANLMDERDRARATAARLENQVSLLTDALLCIDDALTHGPTVEELRDITSQALAEVAP